MQRKRLNVLCVEDNVEMSASLQRALREAGHGVVACAEGAAGLDLLIGGEFDVAIVDIGLPFMNGYQVARGAREILGDSAPPLVALTGYAQRDDARASEAAGFAAHLTKPVSLPNLLSTIEGLTGVSGARSVGAASTREAT